MKSKSPPIPTCFKTLYCYTKTEAYFVVFGVNKHVMNVLSVCIFMHYCRKRDIIIRDKHMVGMMTIQEVTHSCIVTVIMWLVGGGFQSLTGGLTGLRSST